MKRLFDLLVSSVALVALSPILAVIALSVAVRSGRPVLFRHQRVGLGGKPFYVLKFRTMTTSNLKNNPAVTSENDERITDVGRLLRGLKLDELPQLWNVVLGDMSFVGPRPEVARYVSRFPEEFAVLHRVRPGITDPSSIKFRTEEEFLSKVDDPEAFYIEELLPQKIVLSMQYVQDQSFVGDIKLIAATLRSIAGGLS